jgi:hypothetical protein
MSLLRTLFPRLFGAAPAPVTAPAPAPATAPESAPIAGQPIDTRHWTPSGPGFVWDGTRVEWRGQGHGRLTSPRMRIPADRRLAVAATAACDTWGSYQAKVGVFIQAFSASGLGGGHGGSELAASGTVRADARLLDSAETYEISLIFNEQFEGGTNDTKRLTPRMVNVCTPDS